jgi:hypothetical protein
MQYYAESSHFHKTKLVVNARKSAPILHQRSDLSQPLQLLVMAMTIQATQTMSLECRQPSSKTATCLVWLTKAKSPNTELQLASW